MSAQEPTKAAVSVAEMARMVGLSRARFYQLQKAGIFPQPERDEETGRPFYTEELQKVCLEVRRRNCGVNGKPILFNAARRQPAMSSRPRTVKAKVPKLEENTELVEYLKEAGLTKVTAAQVEMALAVEYPQGTSGDPLREVIRRVFKNLNEQGLGR